MNGAYLFNSNGSELEKRKKKKDECKVYRQNLLRRLQAVR